MSTQFDLNHLKTEVNRLVMELQTKEKEASEMKEQILKADQLKPKLGIAELHIRTLKEKIRKDQHDIEEAAKTLAEATKKR